MLVELKRIVAYICPFCSNISSKALSVFNFSGTDKVQLICPTHGCHETCVRITEKNEKYKLDIKCPLCGETHSYTVSKKSFWQKHLITYKCPIAGIDIFFAGKRDEVQKKLDENNDVYSDIIDDFDEDDDSFNLMYTMIDKLHTMKDTHRITCACGGDDIDLNVMGGSLVITCRRCKRFKVIEATEENLTRILNSHSIVIDG